MRFESGQELILLPKLTVVRYTRGGWVLCSLWGTNSEISIPESFLATDKFFELRPKKRTILDRIKDKFGLKN